MGKDNFVGVIPQQVFVGRFGYPNVFLGPLTATLDSKSFFEPEEWYRKKMKIDEVIDIRSSLIYPRSKLSIRSSNRTVEVIQETIISQKPCDVEVWLKKAPKSIIRFYRYAPPVANPAPLKRIKLIDNPKIPRFVEKIINDIDLKAKNGVVELYKRRLPVSRIHNILSVGLLGTKVERRLVPTRWSVTAVDDILSRDITEKIKDFDTIDKPVLFSNYYLGNHYEILLIPGIWSYELIEVKFPGSVWNPQSNKPKILKDYEGFHGRKDYATETVGGYYATRLGVVEHLKKIRRQASVLVIRECLPEYKKALGVWVVRETVRHAFDKPGKEFDNLYDALNELKKRLSINWNLILTRSRLLKEVKNQQKILRYI